MQYGTTTRTAYISYSDTARAVLRDGPCWAAACTRLPAPPFDSERTGPGRRPYKRNAAPPYFHRNGAPTATRLKPTRAALGVLRPSPHKEHFAGPPPPHEEAIETAWSPNQLESQRIGRGLFWERPHLENQPFFFSRVAVGRGAVTGARSLTAEEVPVRVRPPPWSSVEPLEPSKMELVHRS